MVFMGCTGIGTPKARPEATLYIPVKSSAVPKSRPTAATSPRVKGRKVPRSPTAPLASERRTRGGGGRERRERKEEEEVEVEVAAAASTAVPPSSSKLAMLPAAPFPPPTLVAPGTTIALHSSAEAALGSGETRGENN